MAKKWYPVTMQVKRSEANKRAKKIRQSGAHARLKKIVMYTDNTLSRKKRTYVVEAHD